jgi:hypothetical protein
LQAAVPGIAGSTAASQACLRELACGFGIGRSSLAQRCMRRLPVVSDGASVPGAAHVHAAAALPRVTFGFDELGAALRALQILPVGSDDQPGRAVEAH